MWKTSLDVTDKAEQEMLIGVAPLFDCGTSNLPSNSKNPQSDKRAFLHGEHK
jgi:hypothetical protein